MAGATRSRYAARNPVVDALVPLTLPIAVGLFFLRRSLKNRRTNRAAGAAKAAEKRDAAASTTAKAKPRRDFKVKRDRQEVAEEVAAVRQAQLMEQKEKAVTGLSDNVAEESDDGETEALGQAGAGGGAGAGGQQNFFNMLQSMGFKVVAPKDGSNQVFLVPPGQEGAAAGEDGGADEDEDDS